MPSLSYFPTSLLRKLSHQELPWGRAYFSLERLASINILRMEPAVGLASDTDPSMYNNSPIFLFWMNKKAGLFEGRQAGACLLNK